MYEAFFAPLSAKPWERRGAFAVTLLGCCTEDRRLGTPGPLDVLLSVCPLSGLHVECVGGGTSGPEREKIEGAHVPGASVYMMTTPIRWATWYPTQRPFTRIAVRDGACM